MGELFDAANQWLDRIEESQDFTLPYLDPESHTQPVRLNLMMSFWLYGGEQLEIRELFFQKVLDYIKLTGVEFVREASVSKQRERKFRKEGFPENWIKDIQTKSTWKSLIYYFSDQPNMSFAPRFGLDISCGSEIGDGKWYSTANFIFPFDYVQSEENRIGCIQFFKSVLREFKIEQAYCGFRVGQPLDFTKAVPWQVFDTAAAYRFLGIDIEKNMSQTSANDNEEPSLEKGVRSTNWLLYLAKTWTDQLGIIDRCSLNKAIEASPLQAEEINGGIFFQAAQYPQLARIGTPRPKGYQRLNDIIKPIREKMLPLTQYADSLADWEPVFFQPEQCNWWLERWDREDDTELLKQYPNK